MPETADNKRTEEQNSIALEQEERRDQAEITPESQSEKDSQAQAEQPSPESGNEVPDKNRAEESPENSHSLAYEADTTTEGSQHAVEAKENTLEENKEASGEEPIEKAPEEEAQSPNETSPATLAEALDTDDRKETSTGQAGSASEDDTAIKSEASSEEESEDESDAEEESEEDDLQEEAHIDYSHYSKKQLTETTEALLKETDIKSADRKLNEIKTYFDEIENEEYNAALEKFLAEGGEKEGFDYKPDQLSDRFHAAYKKLKERKAKHYAELEAEKEANLHARQALLEKLRNLVDNEETNQSISELKKLQQEWRSIGPAPKKYAKSLWASYNALVYRFYDNISIYYELKELDRRKNLEAKLHLCERAESLVDQENIKEAIKELDTLHEEFKHIGPVPKEEQEPLWERFKAASDAIHARRREYVDQLKEDLQQNLKAKLALAEKVQPFADFDSDSIKAWNEKTREIRELQSQWETIGGIPREQAKEVNKTFWSGFKKFFANKGHFFKKLDSMREENLKKKEELLVRAEALKESTDWQRTANELKQLQQEWKDIGPVPEKQREVIYKKFKAACDEFFNNRRASFREEEKDYEKNLKAKEAICEKIEEMAAQGSNDVDALLDLNDEYQELGFVPKKAIKTIQKKYEQAVEKFLANAHELDEEEKQEIKFNLQFSKLKNSPNAQRKLGNKETVIRKQISKLEDDLSVWKNNLNFFADSKQADKLKEEFGKKIEKADAEVRKLKQQLRVLRDM